MSAVLATDMERLAAAERWMSYGQAAAYSTLSERTLRRLVADGELHVARVGGRLVIERRELDKTLRSRTN